jgi:hypothetical protein
MTEPNPTSRHADNPAPQKANAAGAVSDASSLSATPGQPAPVTPEGTVTVTDQAGMPSVSVGDISPPPADATHVYISLTFLSIEKETSQALIDAARSVVGRDKSFSVTFGEAIGEA